MCEIKFRAMTNPPKDFADYHFESKMVYGTGIFFDGVNHWLYAHDISLMANDFKRNIIKPKTIGQFTGLLDKNSKEIYEGDILDCGGIVEYFNNLTWEGGCPHPGFYCKKWFEYGEPCELSYHDNFEGKVVISNIHETPELL